MSALIQKKWGFFKTARIIFDEALFLKLIKDKYYANVVLISHKKLEVPSAIRVKKKPTVLIDFDKKSPEEILQSFNDTARNEIRRTFKMPELLFQMGGDSLSEIYALYKSFRKAKHLPLRKKNFFKESLIFKAYWNEELVSVITCYAAHPALRVQNIFSKNSGSDKDLRRIVGYATRRLIYEICVYGYEHGYILLDLAGINLIDPEKAGITAFKKSFGGSIIDEYTYTYRHPFFRAFTRLKKRS